MTVTAEIDVTRQAGRKLVRELKNRKYVKLSYPFTGELEHTYSHEDVFRSAEKIMNDYFDTNIKLNV